MKKSQVLAALALAFALGLGVVAPVANVNAFSAENSATNQPGSATGKEVDNAIAAVEANGTYKQATALIDAYEGTQVQAPAAVAEYVDFNATLAGKVVSALEDATKVQDLNIAGVLYNTTNATLAQTKDVVKEVTTGSTYGPKYKVYADLYNAIEDKNDAKLRDAVAAYDSFFRIENKQDTSSDTSYNTLVTYVEGLAGYDDYSALVEAVEAAKTNYESYDAGIAALNGALTASGVLSATGKTALQNAQKAANDAKAEIQVSTLAAIINDGTKWVDGNFSFSLTKWDAVAEAVENAVPNDDQDTTPNYAKIKSIAETYKAATGNTTTALTDIMKELVGYQAPVVVEPGEGDNKPGDGEGDDQNQGNVNPGDTGVISAADGTASSTVAIVAGIATALTAAGAGVVAYRNARRAGKEA